YSDKTKVTFHPAPATESVTTSQLRAGIDAAVKAVQGLTAPEGKGEALAPVKQNTIAALEAAKGTIPAAEGFATSAQATAAEKAVAVYANEEWQQDLVAPVARKLDEFSK